MAGPVPFIIETVTAEIRSPDQTVVDIGCGPGFYRDAFPCRYIGVDYTDGPYGNIPRIVDVVASADDLPLPDASADVVFAVSAFFLFPDHGRALGEFRRILKPDGTLLLFDYNRRTQKRLEQAHGMTHPRWTTLQLARLVRQAGFSHVRPLLPRAGRSQYLPRPLWLLKEEIRGQWAIVRATPSKS